MAILFNYWDQLRASIFVCYISDFFLSEYIKHDKRQLIIFCFPFASLEQ